MFPNAPGAAKRMTGIRTMTATGAYRMILRLYAASTMMAAIGANIAVFSLAERSAPRISATITRYFARSLGRRASNSGSTANGSAIVSMLAKASPCCVGPLTITFAASPQAG